MEYIGRDKELNQVRQLLAQASQGQGSIIFIQGEYGIGKTAFINKVKDMVQNDQQLKKAMFVRVYCDRTSEIAENSAYQPFKDILSELAKEEEKNIQEKADHRQKLNRVLQIIKEVAGDWFAIIPVAGPLINATAKTVISAVSEPSNVSDISLSRQTDLRSKAEVMYSQYIDAITSIASVYKFLVIVIEQAEWIDNSSCILLLRLSRTIQNYPIVFIITYRPESVNKQLSDVRIETLKTGVAYSLKLSGWTVGDINIYLQSKYDAVVHPNLAAWLHDLCSGIPLFVTSYLSLLEEAEVIEVGEQYGMSETKKKEYKLNGDIRYEFGQWKPEGRLANQQPESNETIDEYINKRINGLLEGDKEETKYLQIGSVQGSRFMSIVLARILKKEEIDINNKLRVFERNLRIIKQYRSQDWSTVRIDVFEFELLLLQQILYNRLYPSEKTFYHKHIAEVLESFIKDKVNPLHRLMLEIARHYQMGSEYLLAAKYYFEAHNLVFVKVRLRKQKSLCKRALENIRTSQSIQSIPKDEIEYEKLHAQIIELNLSLSENWWRGKPGSEQSRPENEILVEEAEATS